MRAPAYRPVALRRALVLDEAPSIDRGEIPDKGSINRRAALTHRAGRVEALCAEPPGPPVILAHHEGAGQ